jgi:hypothetical protein
MLSIKGTIVRRNPESATNRLIAASTMMALVAHLLVADVEARLLQGTTAQVIPDQANAEIVQVVFSRGIVTITYDLVAPDPQSMFEVEIEVSANGGQTYDVRPRSMRGDVGGAVSPGRGKRVVWEAAKETESLQTDQFRFRVVIRIATRPEEPPGAPPATSSETRPGTQPLAPSTNAPAPRQAGVNRLFWTGLVMFGVGGTLAAMAGAGPLRTREDYVGFYELTPNKPLMYGGIGVAAGGLVMMLLGRRTPSTAVSIVMRPGGVVLSHATSF